MQLIQRKMHRFQETVLNNEYNYWDFYMGLNICRAVESFDVQDIGLKNKRIIELLLKKRPQRNRAYFDKAVTDDCQFINSFLEKYKNREKEETGSTEGLKNDTTIAVLDFEFED